MARIPQAEIERLKEEVSVERLVEASGIALKKTGKDLTGCCPFHEDGTASLVVTPSKNLWHCFGCGTGGGPIDWVMKKNGVSFRHAVELLREGIPSLAAGAEPVKRTSMRKLDAPVAFDADDQALLNQVVDYYHQTLRQSPEALAYLEARGLGGSAAQEAVDTFKLGYANRTLGLRLPDKRRKEGADIRARLEKTGLYRESGHEHFNGSLIIPVLDEQGNVVEVYGRKLRDDLRAGTPKHLYLPGPHAGVWNMAALSASREIILCEALIDALTFWCAGFRNVTSAYGIEGFTEEHIEAFKRHGTERVLIAFDRDEAGERGAAKVAERLMAEGVSCYRIQFPKGMDANEYALKVAPAQKSLGLLIRTAVWLGQGKAPARPEGLPHMHGPVQPADAPPPQATVPAETVSPLAAVLPDLPASLSMEEPAPAGEPEPMLPASPLPSAPVPEAAAEVTAKGNDSEVVLSFGPRRYRVRGLSKNLAYEVLKVNLLAGQGEAFHVDTLDLYAARQRAAFVTQAAIELSVPEDVIKADLGRVLLKLEQLQDEQIRQTLAPAKSTEAIQLSEAERAEALALLQSPGLMARILADFAACGLVGEETNKLVGYLAAVSRKLSGPLAVVVQSTSAAGKSSLMDAVLAFVPEEERVKYSAMTGQSLFYMGEANLKHRILAIAEEEGASRAAYALKLLQSDGELTMASTGKDPVTGNLVTQAYRVEGPVMIFLTTTAIEIDEELLNRCIVLSVDEGRAQTEAIHELQRQRRTLQGLQARQDKERLIRLHRNAQRLLKPLAVVNPYAGRLTFRSDQTRTRRDHEKYLTLIDTIALLHQHQRPVKTLPASGDKPPLEYIEVELADIEQANRLAHDVLGRSLDELPPQTRRLLAAVAGMVQAQCEAQQIRRADFRFSRKEVRAAIGWGDTQLRLHLARLVEMEYLLAHREGAGGRYVYELVYDGDASETLHLSGLLDPAELRASDTAQSGTTTAKSRGESPEVAGRSRGGSAPVAAPSRAPQNPSEPAAAGVAEETTQTPSKTHLSGATGKVLSYPHPLAAASR